MAAFESLSVFFIFALTIFTIAGAVPVSIDGSDSRKYLIETEQTYNWFQALHACARANQQLVQIESGTKNLVVLRILKTLLGNSRNLWIGANDEFVTTNPRPFYWIPSGQVMTYSYWKNGQPDNNLGRQHCVHTWNLADNFKWNDAECNTRMGYICEQKEP